MDTQTKTGDLEDGAIVLSTGRRVRIGFSFSGGWHVSYTLGEPAMTRDEWRECVALVGRP